MKKFIVVLGLFSLLGCSTVATSSIEDSKIKNACDLLSEEKVSQIMGIILKSRNTSLRMHNCNYGDGKNDYVYIAYPNLDLSLEERRDLEIESSAKNNYIFKSLDELQKNAFMRESKVFRNALYINVNGKPFVIMQGSDSTLITEEQLISLAKAILEVDDNLGSVN